MTRQANACENRIHWNKDNGGLVALLTAVLLPATFLTGCGADDPLVTDNSAGKTLITDAYSELPGDTYTMVNYLTADYSTGNSIEATEIKTVEFSQVTDIPSRYGYSNAILAPYYLERTLLDGNPNRMKYRSQFGDSIINDDLDTFKNIEFTESFGSEDPESVQIGQLYNWYENAVLFDSDTAEEVGYEISVIDATAEATETVTVAAGEFSAVKFGYRISMTRAIEDEIDSTNTAAGYIWLEETYGFLVKMTVEGDLTFDTLGITAAYEAETVLQSYSFPSISVLNFSQANSNILSVSRGLIDNSYANVYSSLKTAEQLQ